MRQKKKGVKKKIPMRESNPRPLNLQPPHSYRLRDFARTIIIPTYTGNLDGDELRVASLTALAPPINSSVGKGVSNYHAHVPCAIYAHTVHAYDHDAPKSIRNSASPPTAKTRTRSDPWLNIRTSIK